MIVGTVFRLLLLIFAQEAGLDAVGACDSRSNGGIAYLITAGQNGVSV